MNMKLIGSMSLVIFLVGCSTGKTSNEYIKESETERWHVDQNGTFKVQGLSNNHTPTSLWARMYIRENLTVGVAVELPLSNCTNFSKLVISKEKTSWNGRIIPTNLQCLSKGIALLYPSTKLGSQLVLKEFREEFVVEFRIKSNNPKSTIFSAYNFQNLENNFNKYALEKMRELQRL
ncbi:hypothetical protein [Vibrio jasicida]|uniref:hypothetical protein n=1 Tax=Vibrio jasicida TaxID=766224 RepID=UPI000CE3A30D|nr:hypothetical protein [Vibrio jasicida]